MRTRCYSPQLSPQVVSLLYHEAKRRQIPMTKLADELLRDALQIDGTQLRHLELEDAPMAEPKPKNTPTADTS